MSKDDELQEYMDRIKDQWYADAMREDWMQDEDEDSPRKRFAVCILLIVFFSSSVVYYVISNFF